MGWWKNWRLSVAIDRVVRAQIGRQENKLLTKFADMQSTTLNDACDVISDSAVFQTAGLHTQSTTDVIREIAGGNDDVRLASVPLEAIANSTVIAEALKARLDASVPLRAAAYDLGIDLGTVTTRYAPAFLNLAVRKIVEQLAENKTALYAGLVVLAVAEDEAYELAGVARHRDMVKFFQPTYTNRDQSIRRAQKFWMNRNSSRYSYRRNIYSR